MVDNSEPPAKRVKVDQDAEFAPGNLDGGDQRRRNGGKEKHKSKSSRARAPGKAKDKDGKPKDRRRGTRRDTEEDDPTASKVPRLPKRQCALLIGFCGTGCNGMQIQPDVRTIEGVLFDAMVKAGAVSQDNADDPVKVNLGRAARTDAGVHAAGNLVSIKMITAIPGVPDITTHINELLPPEIRLWSFLRVQNSFSARTRKYTYTFPSYVLLPPKPGSGLYKAFRSQKTADADQADHSFWADAPSPSTKEEDLHRKRLWRISPEQLQALRDTAKKFEGSHNFHNFTVGRDFGDRSNLRYMKEIEIEDPVVLGDTEWISARWHGQSFMLHQVCRKMMAAMILSCRTGTPAQIIDEMYGPRVVFVPKMPSLGLLLEYPVFEGYNRKVEAVNEKFTPEDPDYRPPIDFEAHREEMEKFKMQYIYKNIREVEDQDGLFDAWIRYIDSYSGNDLLYLNPKGIIPPVAVLKRGEKRENPFREKKKFDVTGKLSESKIKVDLEDEEEAEEETLDKAKLADTEG
ncbi:hypothetical protein JAAARDRAFT_123132 [Jaapia argillacea MUCL 33604]|uniref:Pseudouridine synthase I TruA alpha/beta domain-containing protein n=1 Tax=Jaapia argillacea MUCL 33604 TaxID=933084 RepID=A0A067QFL1_9AGAM|nr:hypothetical protein JAAARDRAFT_123132 [Jaapia argillacea MUCL 33604]